MFITPLLALAIVKLSIVPAPEFISNPNDRYLLIKDDYQNEIVNIISKSLIEILI